MKNNFIYEGKTKRFCVRYLSCLRLEARKHRKNPTKAESIVWNGLLRNDMTGYRFNRQKPINRFIIDFYCSSLLIAIEVDGSSHNNNTDYDLERDKFLLCLGIRTLRIINWEIMNELDKVKERISLFIRRRKEEIGESLPCQREI